MEGVSFSMLRVIPTSFRFNEHHHKLGRFNLKNKDLPQITFSSIRSEGNGKGQEGPRKVPTSKRTAKQKDDNKIPQLPDANNINASNQREILALFRRIQSSISKGTSAEAKSNPNNFSEKKNSLEPILESILQSTKDRTPDTEGRKALSRRRVLPKKEQGNTPVGELKSIIPLSGDQQLEDNPTLTEFKSTRPPSNFVKQSPIQASKGNITKPSGKVTAETPSKQESSQSLNIEKLKLIELKEVAKSRGIKGYSRMKKKDLVELLRS